MKANYALNNYSEVIWLLGDGRSGTTWVCDLINYDRKYRELFEPFHPQIVQDMNFLLPHQYVSSHDSHEKLERIASDVFSGRFKHPRVDAGNRPLKYKGLLIKDIFANLFCYWACLRFQEVKPVLLIRNPFSVALSKYKKKNWFWATEPLDLLNQATLYKDYLRPFEEVIRKTSSKKNYILNQIVIWSIINYIPLRQFKPEAIHVCFYENILAEPNQEISKILKFASGGTLESCEVNIATEIINRPSRVSGIESNLLSGTSPVVSWKNELDHQLIDDGLEILQCFGLEKLYNEMSIPNSDVLRSIHGHA